MLTTDIVRGRMKRERLQVLDCVARLEHDSLATAVIQVIVAGKLRAQRAKAMKFRDGYMIKSGRVREGECLYIHVLICRMR